MKRILSRTIFLCIILSLSNVHGEVITTSAHQRSVSVSIYNSDLALVRDSRELVLPLGTHTLAFKEISSGIIPETAILNSEGLEVIEQNFEFDLLSPKSLLEKYVGKEIWLLRKSEKSDEERKIVARVLSTTSGIVLKVGDHIETSVDGRMIFPDVPPTLREKPTLTMLMTNNTSDSQLIELSYLTNGLSWKADYVAELNADENRLDLKGWVTLTNRSGAKYVDAHLKLIAGDVNRAPEPIIAMEMASPMKRKSMGGRQKQVREESFFEYHLYTVNRPTTILENQSKQIGLLEENNGTCWKELVYSPARSDHYWSKMGKMVEKEGVDVILKFKNDKESNFGLPKPAGIFRVYKKDSEGFSQFVGEDRIDHTPENEQIAVKLGRAFDVTVDKEQTDFSFVSRKTEKLRIYESEYSLTIKNAKERDVVVAVKEHIPGDWQVLSESHPHKSNAATSTWQIPVAAKQKTTLTYRVRIVL